VVDPSDREARAAVPEVSTFRATMARWATGVAVVTTVVDGVDHAMTANTVVSVSLDPLLLLVSVERATRFHAAISDAPTFGVSVLAEDQADIARWLATTGRPLAGQLDRVPHRRGSSGVALVAEALVTVECRVWARYDGGDHELVVGEVAAMTHPRPEVAPLLYFRSGYRGLSET
jgi:flavin reductase (DIM6/NTAB) family NADH-FMN oxidoreductase RutF